MPATGTIAIDGLVEGLPTGKRVFQASISSSAAVDHTVTVNLTAGTNTITVPSGTTAAVIIPPTTNTQTISLRGAAGDTGVALSRTKPTVLSFDTTVTSFILVAGGTINGLVVAFM